MFESIAILMTTTGIVCNECQFKPTITSINNQSQYKTLADEYQQKADYYNYLALTESKAIESSIACDKPSESKVYNPWKGTQIGGGGGIITGSSASKNANVSIIANYKPVDDPIGWNFNTIGQFDFSSNSNTNTTTKDMLYIQQNSSYMFDKTNGTFAQVSYLKNAFDGYYYRWNENIGYQLKFLDTKDQSLALSAGPGLQQQQRVGTTGGATYGQWLTQLTYSLNVNSTLTFYEQLQNVATTFNVSTYSISTLNLQVYKNFGIGLNFQYNYNSVPADGKSQTTTTTSLNIVYSIN